MSVAGASTAAAARPRRHICNAVNPHGCATQGRPGAAADELKTLVREAHRRGIEVLLDVVFNHTAEGNELGPYISLRGVDNRCYYMLAPEGQYYNYSGCGNTLNCNDPVARHFVLDCLRYWVQARAPPHPRSLCCRKPARPA